MGLLGKVLGTVGAIVGGTVVAKKIAEKISDSPKKRLEALEVWNVERRQEYQCEKESLLEKIARGDNRASRRLAELEKEYKEDKREYEDEKELLLLKLGKSNEKKMIATFDEKIENINACEQKTLEKTIERTEEKTAKCLVKNFCSYCGAKLGREEKFCGNCGNKIWRG